MTAFTDAAAAAVAKAIASVQREAQREREIREAQFAAKMAELETRIAAVSEVERRMVDRLSTLKDGEPGSSVTVEDVAPMVERLVAEKVGAAIAEIGPLPELPNIPAIVEEFVAARLDVDDMERSIQEVVRSVVAELPPSEPGKDGAGVSKIDVELIEDGQAATFRFTVGDTEHAFEVPLPAGKDGEKGDPGERGIDGAPGALPTVKEWEDRVYYQGEVVSFEGGVFQSSKDTGKSPEHGDWTCIVAKGRDGTDGKSFNPTGLHDAEKSYERLDVVMLNGASFVANRDDPGECPGDGWNLLAAQGKQGKPGVKGDAGIGQRGHPGVSLKKAEVIGDGLLRFVNGDDSVVECDLYPLLSSIA